MANLGVQGIALNGSTMDNTSHTSPQEHSLNPNRAPDEPVLNRTACRECQRRKQKVSPGCLWLQSIQHSLLPLVCPLSCHMDPA